MTLGTSYVPDLVPDVTGGVTQALTSSQLATRYPGQTMTPSATFTLNWKGHSIHFVKNRTVVVAPDVKAHLQSFNAPIA